jgi:capsular exopolysaccharide synthesis family protein
MHIIDKPERAPALPQPPAEGERVSVHRPNLLVQLLSLLRRRYRTILIVAAVTFLAGLTYTLLATKQYAAEALVEIKRENDNLVSISSSSAQQMMVDQEFYETQYGLLRSQSLAERVATDLRLFDDRAFFQELGAIDPAWVQGSRFVPATRAARIRSAGAILLNHLSVASERQSRLVRIRFVSPDPQLSKRVVDAWSRGFIGATLERRYEATTYARNFLEGRLSQLRERINQSERDLVRYAGQQGIVNLPGTNAGADGKSASERSLVDTNLESLNDELAKATSDRIAAQSRLQTPAGQAAESLGNQAISLLRQERATKAADYAKLMTQFEPDYPPARQLKAQLDQLDRSISVEEGRVSGTLRKTYEAALEREALLQSRVGSLKANVLDTRQRSIQYNIYLRDVDTNRQLYDALLQRYKEIGVAGGVGSNNISVVDAAELPLKPSWPKGIVILLAAVVAGAILGFGVALLQEQLDRAVSDPQQIPDELGVPLLGTIPIFDGDDVAAALRDRKSILTEAYNSTRMTLSLATEHGFPRVVAVTSTRASEGKTTTSFALANLLTRSNNRVLLVDADMRRPAMHRLFGVSNDDGLSNYLAGDDDLARLIQPTETSGLSLMTAGPNPPSTPELLETQRLDRLLAEVAADYQYIVIDAPPLLGLADAPLIGSRVEGVVFVVQAHSSQKSMAQVAINRLKAAHVTVLGAVLTKFDHRQADYGYSYNYGYSYGDEKRFGRG